MEDKQKVYDLKVIQKCIADAEVYISGHREILEKDFGIKQSETVSIEEMFEFVEEVCVYLCATNIEEDLIRKSWEKFKEDKQKVK